MRFLFEVAYHGGNYNGWQSQPNGVGVQSVIEETMSTLLRSPVKITGSGRTDAGVHCEQQFFHVDLADLVSETDRATLIQKLNSFLPADIAIRSIHRVRPDVNARYDAVERTYRYQITRVKNPFLQDFSLHYFKKLEIENMNRAAALLVGEHDFQCFSKVKTDVNHFICDIRKAGWTQAGDEIIFRISGNRFLRGMVRAIVGTLIDVGSGRITHDEFVSILQSRDRRNAGANAPAHALFLEAVKYPEEIFIK